MRNINNNKFEFISNHLLNVSNLEKVTVNAKYNCCSSFSQTLQFKSLANLKMCTALYCNYSGQIEVCNGQTKFPQNCYNPKGSYYFRLTQLTLRLNGQDRNILDRTYNLTDDNEIILLKALVASKLPNINFNINRYYDQQDYLCFRVDFIDLPSGVIPRSFILRNEDTCFVTQEFNCVEIDDTKECIEYSLKLPLARQLVKTITVGQEYLFNYDLDLTGTTESNEVVILDFINNVSTAIPGLALIYEIVGTDIIFRHTNKELSSVDVYLEADNKNRTVSFYCSKTDKLPIIPVYSTRVYIDKNNLLQDIYAYNIINPNFHSPVNKLNVPLINLTGLYDVLKVTNPNIKVNIINGNDYVDIEITNVIEVPYDIVIFKDGEYISYPFSVIALTNISSNYNSNLIEYLYNKLYIKPNFFNFNEKFEDGIYSFDIDIVTETKIYNYKFCIFVFNSYCVLQTIDKSKLDRAIALIDVINYTINCGCDCQTACDYFQELTTILYNHKC